MTSPHRTFLSEVIRLVGDKSSLHQISPRTPEQRFYDDVGLHIGNGVATLVVALRENELDREELQEPFMKLSSKSQGKRR